MQCCTKLVSIASAITYSSPSFFQFDFKSPKLTTAMHFSAFHEFSTYHSLSPCLNNFGGKKAIPTTMPM